MRHRHFALAACCALNLAGCANTALERYINKDNVLMTHRDYRDFGAQLGIPEVVDEPKCQGVDWHAVGRRDGRMWRDKQVTTIYQENCRPAGVMFDAQAYSKGYDESAAAFCTQDRGLEYGKIGKVFGPCLTGQWKAFSNGFTEGRKEYCTYDRGFSEGTSGRENPACAENTWVDYAKGYANGLEKYCTGELGYREGSRGSRYPESCPKGRWPGVEAGFRQGLATYCSPSRMLEYGRKGAGFPDVCEPQTEWPNAAASYRSGLAEYCSYDRGQRTGEAGEAPPPACAGAGLAEWTRGYRKGLAQHCRAKGLERGLRDSSAYPPDACTEVSDIFRHAFDAGKQVYDSRSRVRNLESQRKSVASDLSKREERAKENEKIITDLKIQLHAVEDDLRFERRRLIQAEDVLEGKAIEDALSDVRSLESSSERDRATRTREIREASNDVHRRILLVWLHFAEEDLAYARERELALERRARGQ